MVDDILKASIYDTLTKSLLFGYDSFSLSSIEKEPKTTAPVENTPSDVDDNLKQHRHLEKQMRTLRRLYKN